MTGNQAESGCSCGRGRAPELSRRQFLKAAAAGSAGLALGAELLRQPLASAQPQNMLTRPDLSPLKAYPVTQPRRYSGEHLEYVLMPIGGIGTGTIWLDGQGRLAVWQIFNNYTESRIPDSFFAIRAQAKGQQPVTRVLQTVAEPGWQPVQGLTYEGGYPIARIAFQDQALPVQVRLDAFNPMIPTDAANSSLPCAIFRLTAQNTGGAPVEVSLLGALQNAVGSQGAAGINGVSFGAYGRNRNRLVREQGMTALFMEQASEPPPAGLLNIRDASGALVAGPELLWIDALRGPEQTAEAGAQATALVETTARLSREGGSIVAAGVALEFFQAVAQVRARMGGWQDLEVFENFEKDDYRGWTVKGEAFGKTPHTGTSPGQQPVSGFLGRRLVNTFLPNDGPQGELISDPFTLRKRYLGFLLGGGNHPNETCINLRVGGQVVRTATGKDNERLEPMSWDVQEFVGKQAVIEIIDHHSGGWGHINIDHIVFADAPPDHLMRLEGPVEMVTMGLALPFDQATAAALPAGSTAVVAPGATALQGIQDRWEVTTYTKLTGFQSGAKGYQVLATAPNGDPLVISGPLGEARLVLCLASGLPWSWAQRLLAEARGKALGPGERIVTSAPGFGTLALMTPDAGASACAQWTKGEDLVGQFGQQGRLEGPQDSGESPAGQTYNGALAVTFTLQPGEQRAATFVLTWHFPNVGRFGHPGNLCCRRFPDALAAARYVAANLEALWERTWLYHQTVYQSNLPPEFLDAFTSQSVIFRGPTCWWSEDGYFAGYEGCYTCCPLNCTHVWNYAQTHARLFPEVGRNMRRSDLLIYLHEDGETSHRQHGPHNAFMDGHCATIEAAYREHQLSPDNSFLEAVWPNLKKAVDWLINHLDADRDGVPAGQQWNTYDCASSGANTFIGSQYLSALAAAERMAEVMKEPQKAAEWRQVRQLGMRNQDERLWNGEYYIQIPEKPPAQDYNTGCHSDQLLGQWWAHQLNLGYLFPRERVRSVLEAVMKYNFRATFAGFQQQPRRYVTDSEGGLLMCTWPQGGRPDPFIIYADEVWTGIEYAVAGAMIYEGMMEPARNIVATARGRYDGRRRDGLNSGPGGNPFNDLECGKFYARAMSSGSLLVACQGLVLDGPTGVIGFKPNWQPQDHRSFFTAPEGWGLFVQQRTNATQTGRLEVRHGKLSVQELVFAVPEDAGQVKATVKAAGKTIKAQVAREGSEVRLRLVQRTEVAEGQAIEARLSW